MARMWEDPNTTQMTTNRDEIVANYGGSLLGNPNS